MLTRLNINNIALIDKLEVDFSEGMNVLSGETGAGKSIIVDSVNLVLGERADRELIRTGTQSASVEAWFREIPPGVDEILAEQQIETGQEMSLSRELSITGKNICRINGSLSTLATLKAVSDLLVDVHGQHEHQSLFDEKRHIEMLDSFSRGIEDYKIEVAAVYDEYTTAQRKLRSLFGSDGDRERRIDMLKFQIKEIAEANITQGEEEDLETLKKRLNASEEIISALGASYDALYEAEPINVLSALKDIAVRLEGLSRVDGKFEEMAASVNEAFYSLEDITTKVREEMELSSFDAGQLEDTEERLVLISKLKRKYGDPCASGEFMKSAELELQELIDSERLVNELTHKLNILKTKLFESSVTLSEARRNAAKDFEARMVEQLNDLGMNSASFLVNFAEITGIDECNFTRNGIDTVEFYISTNKGEPEKPLRKVASGGEVSRIMLALKNIAADKGGIPTMIFDEIDTGISGRMAQVVAEKLHSISIKRQVICVTHLPQIASMADRHFLIAKRSDETTTRTYLDTLDEYGRVSEVARLSGGDSQIAKEHAKEMLEKAHELKKAAI